MQETKRPEIRGDGSLHLPVSGNSQPLPAFEPSHGGGRSSARAPTPIVTNAAGESGLLRQLAESPRHLD